MGALRIISGINRYDAVPATSMRRERLVTFRVWPSTELLTNRRELGVITTYAFMTDKFQIDFLGEQKEHVARPALLRQPRTYLTRTKFDNEDILKHRSDVLDFELGETKPAALHFPSAVLIESTVPSSLDFPEVSIPYAPCRLIEKCRVIRDEPLVYRCY
jgi:hypothetical protein